MELPDPWEMSAIRMMPCGNRMNSVEHRDQEPKTHKELRAVVMKCAINRKITNEVSIHDPMDCNRAQIPDWTDPTWYSQNGGPDSTQGGTQERTPQDVSDRAIRSQHRITFR